MDIFLENPFWLVFNQKQKRDQSFEGVLYFEDISAFRDTVVRLQGQIGETVYLGSASRLGEAPNLVVSALVSLEKATRSDKSPPGSGRSAPRSPAPPHRIQEGREEGQPKRSRRFGGFVGGSVLLGWSEWEGQGNSRTMVGVAMF